MAGLTEATNFSYRGPEACREAGPDEDGRRCATCPLRDPGASEEGWLVKRHSGRANIEIEDGGHLRLLWRRAT
jgi:hypothetical protein